MVDQTPVTKRDLVEQKIEKVFPTPSNVKLGDGALTFGTMAEVIEAAKMMAMSGPAIPPWLQGNPGGCWAVLMQASHWGFEPIAVARMSYEVTNKEGHKQVAYMAQLLHALIEARAPLKGRLRFTFAGEGESRTCTCSGHIRGEVEPLEYTTPPLAKISPKRSPLWSSDPDQQLSYYASRAWSRRYTPDILMGIYDAEELEARPGDRAKDVTAAEALHERLAAAQQNGGSGEGFRPGVVEDTLNNRPAEPAGEISGPGGAEVAPATENEAPAPAAPPETASKKRPKTPKTPEQYREHVAAWVADCRTEQAVEERWRTELGLRNKCQVTSDIKADIRAALIDQRIAQIRSRT